MRARSSVRERTAPARRTVFVPVLAAMLAGCAATHPLGGTGLPAPASLSSAHATAGTSRPVQRTPTTVPAAPAPHLSPPDVPGLQWVSYGASAGQAPYVYVAQTDGGRIGLLWMDSSRLRFRYVPGYGVPEAGPIRPADDRPSTWVPRMVAAFNGGFRLADDVGGYFYAGQLVRPMLDGRAAFQIFTNGRLRVGVWGQDLSQTADTVVVRQNLGPLVVDYQSQASSSDAPDAWGAANGGLPHANRTALGQLSDGALVFAYGSEVPAVDMARAMTQVRARTAMVLDMNKSWPSAFVYRHIAGRTVGQRIQPDIWRDPEMYLHPFKKDFVVAMVP